MLRARHSASAAIPIALAVTLAPTFSSLPACSPNDGSSDGGASGSSGSATTAPLDPSATLPSLSAAQKGELCDWVASRLGGYGTTTSCPGGTGIMVAANQADCVAGLAVSADSCQATVQDEYNCINSVVQLPCTSTYYALTECNPIISCS
jgi:hypothetical protein